MTSLTMGLQDLISRKRRLHRREVDRETDNDDARTIAEPATKAKLIITPLDTHRREVFGSYPTKDSLLAESVDECKQSATYKRS